LPFSMRLLSILFIIYFLMAATERENEHGALLRFAITTALAAAFFVGRSVLKDYKNQADMFTETGKQRKDEVHGLKQYITDYSLLKEAAPNAIYLWEKYFVYGLALGVSKKALNELYEHIPRIGDTHDDVATIAMMHHLSYHYNIADRSSDALRSLDNIVAKDVSRSSDDGGGGFSSGGGDAGGGATTSTF